MPTYLGRNIITIPPTPSSPSSIQFTQVNAVAINISPFTGQQQIQDWNATWAEAFVTMPAMPFAVAQPWVVFLRALKGQANVFQFSAAFMAAFAGDLGSRYWALKSNSRSWSVSGGKIYGMSFEVREVL